MSERDELAAIILDCQQHAQGLAKTADAILQAGYRKPDWIPRVGDSWHDSDTGQLLKAVPDGE